MRLRLLLELVRSEPADEAPWTALSRAVERLASGMRDPDPSWLARRRLVRAHPSLLGHQVAAYSDRTGIGPAS